MLDEGADTKTLLQPSLTFPLIAISVGCARSFSRYEDPIFFPILHPPPPSFLKHGYFLCDGSNKVISCRANTRFTSFLLYLDLSNLLASRCLSSEILTF